MAAPAGSMRVREEAELLADQLAHPPFGGYRAAAPARLRVGSYRLGSDVFLNAWTADDLAAHARRGARCFARLGIDRARAVSHLLPGALAPLGALALADVLDLGSSLDVPIGPLENDTVFARATDVWSLVRPPVVVGPPAELVRLAARAEGDLAARFGIELLVALDEGPLPAATRDTIMRGTGVAVSELLGVRCLYPFLGTRRTPAEPFEVDATGVAVAEDRSGRLVVTALDLTDAPLAVRTRLRGRVVDRTPEIVRIILEEPPCPPES